ncbi:MAG TPA: discoidin domain-containing protein [Actinokineospora sp.]|nr:discoidin domain-containing protein [Actinokineospora sp.]
MVTAVALCASAGLITVPVAAAATTIDFYAAPDGTGTTCSLTVPCSIGQAQLAARAAASTADSDINVYLENGTVGKPAGTASAPYRLTAPLTFTAQDSGQNGHRINWQDYALDTSKAAISGGQSVTGWTLTDSAKNIWSASVPTGTQTRQLFIDGTRVPRARGTAPTMTATTVGYTDTAQTMATWRNPADIEFVFTGGNGPWTEQRCDIASISGTAITMRQPCWDNAHLRLPAGTTVHTNDGENAWGSFPGLPFAAKPSYVENAYEQLTAGHWYLDRSANQVRYIPTAGQTMSSLKVVIPTLEHLVRGTGTLDAPVRNLTFSGITFEHTTWLQPSGNAGFAEMQANMTLTTPGATQGLCNYITPAGSCPFAAWSKPFAAVEFTAAHSVDFIGNTFTRLGAAGLGLSFGSQDNLVQGNEFTGISGSGVLLGDTTDAQPIGGDLREINTRNTIDNNYIHDIGVEYHSGVGIWAGYVQHTKITHNQLNDLPYSGISLGWGGWHTNWQHPDENSNISGDNLVANNLVFHFMQVLRDGGAVYTNGSMGTSYEHGLTISGNVAYDDNTNFDYYNDEGGRYVTITGNINYRNGNRFNGGCSTVGYIKVENNYTHGALHGYPCAGTVGNSASGNIAIPADPGAADLPSSILSAVGLEAAYAGLATKYAPRVAAANLNAGALLISGSGFTPTSTVKLAGQAATNVVYLSSGYLKATAPIGVSQGDVTVTTTAGTSAISPAGAVIDVGSSTNLAPLSTAVASNVYQNSATYNGQKAIDGNTATRWATGFGVQSATLEVTLPGSVSVNRTVLKENQSLRRIQAYTIDYWNGSAWVAAVTRGAPAAGQSDTFTPVTTTKIRLNITQSSDGPSVDEFAIYSGNLALTATAVASNTYQNNATYAASKAIDGNSGTRWATDVNTATLELTLPFAVPVSRTVLFENPSFRRIQAYTIDYWNGSAWVTGSTGAAPASGQVNAFTPVTTTKVRLNITQASGAPTVDEFQVK